MGNARVDAVDFIIRNLKEKKEGRAAAKKGVSEKGRKRNEENRKLQETYYKIIRSNALHLETLATKQYDDNHYTRSEHWVLQ